VRADDERMTLAAFLGTAFLSGGMGVGVRFSNRELDPLWGAGLRFAVAASFLLVIMAALRLPGPRGRALMGVVLYGLLQFGGSFALAYYALVELQAGFGGILLAVVPLLTLLLAVALGQERLRWAAVAGTVVALVGIGVMSTEPLSESLPLGSLVAALGGALCFASSAIVVRGFPRVHPVTMNGLGMTVGAATLIAGALVRGEALTFPDRGETWLALGYLVGFGIVVFMLNLFVLARWSASRFAYVFVLIPLVTVVLSAWLDDEPLGSDLVLGGLLVLSGVYIGALRAPSSSPRAADLGRKARW
jgi:drug/metabolite transporter (DMT)-like permease